MYVFTKRHAHRDVYFFKIQIHTFLRFNVILFPLLLSNPIKYLNYFKGICPEIFQSFKKEKKKNRTFSFN